MMSNLFKVIYADPPWAFEVWGKSNGRNASDKYPVLSRDALCGLPVGELAAENSVLLLWATWPNLPDAMALGQAWGFTYKTCAFDWLKRSSTGRSWFWGMGYYSRANSEPCLLFTKGNPKRKNKGVAQLIVDDDAQLALFPPIVDRVSAHSAKPVEAYNRIERLLDGAYCELFARSRRPGWTQLGNAMSGLDIRDEMPAVIRQQQSQEAV